jgi:hypothetical protein
MLPAMPRPTLLVATAALALLGLGACANDRGADSEDEIRDALTARFEDDGLTAEQAECFANLVIEEVGVEDLKDAEAGDEAPPDDQQEAYATAATRAVDECEIDELPVDG